MAARLTKKTAMEIFAIFTRRRPTPVKTCSGGIAERKIFETLSSFRIFVSSTCERRVAIQNANVRNERNTAQPMTNSKTGNASWVISLPPTVTDETRAGERGVSPFELRKMLSGAGAYELRSHPARCSLAVWTALKGRGSRSEPPKRDGKDGNDNHPEDTQCDKISLLLFLGSPLGDPNSSQGNAADGFYNFSDHQGVDISSADQCYSAAERKIRTEALGITAESLALRKGAEIWDGLGVRFIRGWGDGVSIRRDAVTHGSRVTVLPFFGRNSCDALKAAQGGESVGGAEVKHGRCGLGARGPRVSRSWRDSLCVRLRTVKAAGLTRQVPARA